MNVLRFLPESEVTSGRFKGHKHACVGPSTDESLECWTGFNSKRPITCQDCIDEMVVFREQCRIEAEARYADV
jgi:hypothetical protein